MHVSKLQKALLAPDWIHTHIQGIRTFIDAPGVSDIDVVTQSAAAGDDDISLEKQEPVPVARSALIAVTLSVPPAIIRTSRHSSIDSLTRVLF
jgi:hypothetical protein